MTFKKLGVSPIIKTESEPLKELKCYFKSHDATCELEFLVSLEGSAINITSLKGAHISDVDLRILFRAARIDPESETGRGLISDVYSNIFALSGLSFTFGDSNVGENLKDLARQI